MYRLEPNLKEAYFLVEGSWIHEMLTDVIYSLKEGKNYGDQEV